MKSWEGGADEVEERKFATGALRSFKTALQRAPQKLARIADLLHSPRRPKLSFFLSLSDGSECVNEDDEDGVWSGDDGLLLAAMRQAHGLPPLDRHARVLKYLALAKELIGIKTRAAANAGDRTRELVETLAREAIERAVRR